MSEQVELVNALADGELQGDEKARALEIVAKDPQAAAEHQWATLFKTSLREKLPNPMDDDTWKACRARFDAMDKANRAEMFVGKYAWAFCFIFLVGIFAAAATNRMGGSRPLTNAHVAGLLNGLTPSPISEYQEARDRVQQSVGAAPKSNPENARMSALSLGTVDGRRAAKFTFIDRQGEIGLYVIEGTSGVEGIDQRDQGYRCGRINDCEAISWTESGNLFMLVAPRSVEDMCNVADRIRSSN